jgi:hypothetical protein
VRRDKQRHPDGIAGQDASRSQPYPHAPPPSTLIPLPRRLSSSEAFKNSNPNVFG